MLTPILCAVRYDHNTGQALHAGDVFLRRSGFTNSYLVHKQAPKTLESLVTAEFSSRDNAMAWLGVTKTPTKTPARFA